MLHDKSRWIAGDVDGNVFYLKNIAGLIAYHHLRKLLSNTEFGNPQNNLFIAPNFVTALFTNTTWRVFNGMFVQYNKIGHDDFSKSTLDILNSPKEVTTLRKDHVQISAIHHKKYINDRYFSNQLMFKPSTENHMEEIYTKCYYLPSHVKAHIDMLRVFQNQETVNESKLPTSHVPHLLGGNTKQTKNLTLCGREMTFTKKGRTWVTKYKGKLMSLTEVRALHASRLK